MKGWRAGSQLHQVIIHAQWEDTQIHTGTQSHIQMSKICMRGGSALFSTPPSCDVSTNSLFMSVHPLSSQIDPDIYELALTCISLLSLLLFWGSNTNPSQWRRRHRNYHRCNHQIGLIYDLCRLQTAWGNTPVVVKICFSQLINQDWSHVWGLHMYMCLDDKEQRVFIL